MNIFTKFIFTKNTKITDILVENMKLELKDKDKWMFFWKKEDENVILINSQDFETALAYVKESFEITKIVYIWNAWTLCNYDLKDGDVILPNALLNRENEALFLENTISGNYDLNKFWLSLNGICLTVSDLKEEEIQEIKEKTAADIVDSEVFDMAKKVQKNELLDKLFVIKIIWNEEESLKNWANILELML